MTIVENAIPLNERQAIRKSLLSNSDPFVTALPKVELHIHIEGTLIPELRWNLAQRNGITLRLERTGAVYHNLEQLKESYDIIQARPGHSFNNAEERFTFFEAYYGGFEVLLTKQDFYDLAMNYFEHAAAMNVRYCEPFFDPQGHTRRGVSWETMMSGLREAQITAEKILNVKSKWIMCFLRDMSPESAEEHYEAALSYRDMIIGIGLDSDEYLRPPSLFETVFSRARSDGFHLTCHCDVGQQDTQNHIRQVITSVGGTGAERIDHGLNAAQNPELIELIRQKGIGMTICPWAYLRHEPLEEIFPRMNILFDAGIKISIASDDPAYMEDSWILHNMLLAKRMCNFTNEDMIKLTRNAIDICWAPADIKLDILRELETVTATF
ncbi:hypothetical protein F5884DRAFT_684259 [Xylogone sp. PMI_703]|nr:hypothetical protein F5884DRAFT_684259 [Xylogone sp. PMI_703]